MPGWCDVQGVSCQYRAVVLRAGRPLVRLGRSKEVGEAGLMPLSGLDEHPGRNVVAWRAQGSPSAPAPTGIHYRGYSNDVLRTRANISSLGA